MVAWWWHGGMVAWWHDQFFFNGLGPSLGAKLVSANDRPSKVLILFRLFHAGAKTKPTHFCTNRLEVLRGISVGIFAQKIQALRPVTMEGQKF